MGYILPAVSEDIISDAKGFAVMNGIRGEGGGVRPAPVSNGSRHELDDEFHAELVDLLGRVDFLIA